jgi:ABC-2 type transport system permease protein
VNNAARALAYLWVRSASNRFRTQLKRVRNPRYAIAMLVGVAYIYWALIHNTRVSSQNGINPFADLMRSGLAVPLASALILLTTARWWLFKGDRSALAFSHAEVQFLFPAPISRRGLVHAKLVRGQLAILINVLIWSVFLRGGAVSAAGWQRGIALWLLFSTLTLHRLGAAIVRANALEHEKAGQRRSIIPGIVFTAVLGAVAWGVFSNWEGIRTASEQSFPAAMKAMAASLSQPIPSWALLPVRSVLEPVFANTGARWLQLLPLSVLVFALHYLWVLRLDASFEEAALEATQMRAELIKNVRNSSGIRKRSVKGKIARIPRLSLTGRPEVAITWKNVAAAMRGNAWRMQIIMTMIGLTFTSVLTTRASDATADLFLALCAGWAAMLVLIGPFAMRYDLRLDLPRLAILKTYPLSGAKLVAAEIASTTLLHSLSIWVIMIVPIVMMIFNASMFDSLQRSGIFLVSAALAVPAINLLTFTIQNGAALMFPSWVRLGTESRGFETMGQNLLTMGATTLLSAVALVFPVGLGVLIIWLGTRWLGPWAVLVASLSASALLLAELWPVIFWLGSVFDRTDVSEVAPSQ